MAKVTLDAWLNAHRSHTPETLAREVKCHNVTLWRWRAGVGKASKKNAKRVLDITNGAVELPTVSRKPLPRDRRP